MLTIKELLSGGGLDTPHDRIKLVRHTPNLGVTIRTLIHDGTFDLYQAEQVADVRPFDNCDVILSFLGIEGGMAEFHGAYQVQGSRPFSPKDLARLPDYMAKPHTDGKARIFYDLKELETFRSLRGRVIVNWLSTRGWVQKKDLDVYEILPPEEVIPFLGFQNILLNWAQLKTIFSTPRANRDWKTALRSSAGIYRIVDHNSGKIYIGAAYGAQGIWGRWANYASTGHGGNKMLRDLDPSHFQWSIVRTLSGSMSEREVIAVERIEMAKHGSRAIGLNS